MKLILCRKKMTAADMSEGKVRAVASDQMPVPEQRLRLRDRVKASACRGGVCLRVAFLIISLNLL